MSAIKTTYESGKGIWFTSDNHFFHKNIIKYCKRPFSTMEEMNETMITNWNNVVGKDDTVFILGDFCFGSSTYMWTETLDKLNGKKVLIIGNHDLDCLNDEIRSKFEFVGFQLFIKIEDKKIYLNHYPFLCFGGAYRGENATWQLFGHVHSSELTKNGLDVCRLVNLFPTQYDVGVDKNNFTPISFEQVKEIIYDQQQSLKLIC